MYKVLVYTLEGCNKCEYLLNALDEFSIIYEKHVCEEESEICDNLEEFTNCFTYPILKIYNSDIITVYLAVKTTNKKVQLSHFDVLEWHTSLDSMVNRVKELVKK